MAVADREVDNFLFSTSVPFALFDDLVCLKVSSFVCSLWVKADHVLETA